MRAVAATQARHRGARVLIVTSLLGTMVLGSLVGCSGSPAPPPVASETPTASARATSGQPSPAPDDAEASAVVSRLGAVPIPPSRAPEPTPKAAAGHPALSAAGGLIEVSLGAEGRALVTILGPEQVHNAPVDKAGPKRSTQAYLTLQMKQLKGRATVRADELTSRDETGHFVGLRSVGPAKVSTRSGKISTVKVEGTFDTGAAQVTWRHHGRVLAIWTFTVELD